MTARPRISLAIALCDPVRVLGERTPDSVTPRLPGKVQVVIIKGLEHVLLDENITAITEERFARMLNLGEEGSGYIKTHGNSMGQRLFWKLLGHLMLLYNYPARQPFIPW